MRWRGEQPEEHRRQEVALCDELGSGCYECAVCGWFMHDDGCAYDELMDVCGVCARRIMNLYHRKHGGCWWHFDAATDEDLDYFYESKIRPEARPKPYAKKPIKNAVRLKVYERDGFKCVYCGARKNLSLDHVTAESKGGATTEGNLVTACKTCNSRKKTKTLAEFWEVK